MTRHPDAIARRMLRSEAVERAAHALLAVLGSTVPLWAKDEVDALRRALMED